jgi:hypothetical protein
MNRISVLVIVASAFLSQAAAGDEIRHTTFPTAIIGTWALSAEQCAARDKSNILIEAAKYGDASGSCDVRWIVETAGSQGRPNYAVHAVCTNASNPAETQVVNIIIRPHDNDRASMGRSFEDLKTYQRCPAG